MTVYVVLHADYGDQGADFHGVFATRELADDYIAKKEPVEHCRQWWDVKECEVRV